MNTGLRNGVNVMKKLALIVVLGIVPVWAQQIKFPASFDKLAEKAVDVDDVTVDPAMLQLAGKSLKGGAVSGLKGIQVKSFKFASEGQYSEADVEPIRAQLAAAPWVRVVQVRSKKDRENVEVYIRKEGDKAVGLVVIAAEPKELTIVSIDGPIDLKQLGQLGGSFKIPELPVGEKTEPPKP